MATHSETPFPSVSQTAIWTAIVRARDAESGSPVCDDRFAARFTDAPRTPLVTAMLALEKPTRSIPARHRFFDDIVRKDTAELVVVLGAGLDTRAFRLGVGRRFVEVDHPELFLTTVRGGEGAGVQ